VSKKPKKKRRDLSGSPNLGGRQRMITYPMWKNDKFSSKGKEDDDEEY
jgi:hypothetical protein